MKRRDKIIIGIVAAVFTAVIGLLLQGPIGFATGGKTQLTQLR